MKVRVTRPPEKGKANGAVIDLIAGILGVPASKLRLESGAASRDKVLIVPLPVSAVRERLARFES